MVILCDMKRLLFFLCLVSAGVSSCSIFEEDIQTPINKYTQFYATFEQPSQDETRVYADERLFIRWNADDRIGIFNQSTLNQQYRFIGETGDNAGGFSKVDGAEFVTGNPISHVISVYPYQETTKISEDEVISLSFPGQQSYAHNSFGLGANTMVSVSSDNFLQFKNACGYLMLSLYGNGTSISAIKIKGNNGEKIAGEATITMPVNGVPSVLMSNNASEEITLSSQNHVVLGSSADESTTFWFTLPPVTFSKGFTIAVKRADGTVLTKTTSKSITISRNNLTKMSPFEVETEGAQPNNIIYYTSSNESIIQPYKKADFGANIVSNNYIDGIGCIVFDGYVTAIGDSAFSSISELTSISLPNSVTRIGNSAFSYCTNLADITLSDSITEIDHYAFNHCRSLTSIIVPDSVKSIGSSVFNNCSALTQVVLPNGLTNLEGSTFSNCTSLSKINIPESLTIITGALFYKCSSLLSIDIPESITTIETMAFDGCSSLSSITIPSGLTTIENQVFHNCSSLTSVSIPSMVTSIGNHAFMGCSALVSISIPESVKTIGNYAFSDCTLLPNLIIPENVSSIGDYALKNCTSLSKITVMAVLPPSLGRYILSGTSSNKIFVPFSSIDAYKAEDGWSFYADRILGLGTSYIYYTTTDGKLLIPNMADPFGGCPIVSNEYSNGMGKFTVDGVVTTISSYAFEGCSSLSSMSLPESVTTLQHSIFQGCTNLTGFVIPKYVTSIWSQVFYGCTGLTSITIPEKVTFVGYMAFYSCTSLERVDVRPVVPPTGDQYMFTNTGNCPIYIPAGSEDAYASAEHWKDYVKRMRIEGNDYTSYIYYTTTDGSIITPTVANPFDGCRIVSNEYSNGKGTFTIDGIVTAISSSAFEGCTTLSTIQIPDTVTEIQGAAFSGCSNLSSVTIPESVTSLWYMAFHECTSLSQVTIPKDVTFVGYMAFNNCTNLTRIDVKPTVPPQGDAYMFTNVGSCLLYIPAGSEDAYTSADYWKDYVLRMRVEGNDSSLAYSSTDYSQDGEVMLLQQATVGRGINIIFMGDGFLDKDMSKGGKYDMKMGAAMEQFFAYEPYRSFRDRFNVYAVKVVSKNDIFRDEYSERRLTYEEGDSRYFRTGVCVEYAKKVPNPNNQPLKICTVCNTNESVGRSWCFYLGSDNACSFVMDQVGPVLNHEIGGHGFAFLADEYVENNETFTDKTGLDNNYKNGYGANIDWRNDPNEVRWARFIKDSRYGNEGLGVFEGGYLYAHGIYRATENSMMRYNDTPFNAPSREQIYKYIMKYSEGESWVYDYEDFVLADEKGRREAAEGFGSKKNTRRAQNQKIEDIDYPPISIDMSVKEVGMDKNGKILLVR